MIRSNKIESYSIKIISNYADGGGYQIGFVYLYGENSKYLGQFGIIKDGETLPQNLQFDDGTVCVYFNEKELQPIINILKNQSPVYLKFNTSYRWGLLETGKKSVSKKELAA